MDTIETITYRDYTINIHPDFDHSNPWEDWDCEPPIAVLNSDRSSSYITSYGDQDVIREVLTHWPPSKLWANRNQIIDLIGATRNEVARTLWDYREPGNPDYTRDLFAEFVDETLTEGYLSNSDLLEAISALYRLAGIPAGVQSTQGHSQGDYAEVLVVLTPEWCEKVGYPLEGDNQPTINAAARLWGDWAWGNVYGYTITDPDGEVTDASCWGFYGDYADNFMIDEAKAEIDHLADERLKHLAITCEALRPDMYLYQGE